MNVSNYWHTLCYKQVVNLYVDLTYLINKKTLNPLNTFNTLNIHKAITQNKYYLFLNATQL